uniref:F-box domain-containing protein n=1 Tax=Knipowitschia caucasica TaxID=637954 RepID=A0AAV2KEV2_KNICA
MEGEKEEQLHKEGSVNIKPLDGPASCDQSSDCSPSSGPTGLLSLPWEMVTHIASHLPAQCVITVLPKVCHALRNVGKDNTAWQIRAHRLTGSRAIFPVGPKEDFNWPQACLEMERLITLWTDQTLFVAQQSREQVDERERQGAVLEAGEVGGVDRIGGAAQEVAYGANEGLEVALEGDNQEILGDQQEGAAALINEEIHLRQDDMNPEENIDQRLLGNEQLSEKETKPGRCASPSPALECITLPSDHIGLVTSALLVGGGAERGLIKTKSHVLCLSFKNNVLLTGTHNGKITMYDPRAATPLVKSLAIHNNAVMCLAADDQYIISGSEDSTVAVYDCRAGKGLKKIRLKFYPRSLSYCGSEVWAGDSKGMLHSFSMQAGTFKVLSQFDVAHTAMITGIHLSPGSLYTCSMDKTLKVHIPCSPPRTLCTMQYQTKANGLSVEAGVLAVASGDSCVIWRPRK